MGWIDALKAIPDVIYKVAKLAVDLQNAQKDVEELQKQNRTLAESSVRYQEQIKQLQDSNKEHSATIARLLKLETEFSTLKGLQEAHNKAHMQEIQLAKHDLKDHVNDHVKRVEGTLILGFQTMERECKDAVYKYTQSQAQPPQKFIPAQISTTSISPDGNDGQGNA